MAYPNEKRKNRAGVEAFGTGKPPQPVGTDSLTSRKSGRVGGVKSRRQQSAQQDNSDIDAIFKGAREMRGMVRRGMSGAQLNPDGSDPGSGFNQFLKNNPHLDTREKRQNQYAMENQQRMDNIRQQGPEAVNARRQQQASNQQIGDPNSVTGADGYKTIFDSNNPGKVIGTNAPMDRTVDNAVNRGTASPQEMQDFRGNLQQAGMQSYSSQPKKPNLSGIDQIFPGQSSPPGDSAGSSLVGAGSALGTPGGDFQMPDWANQALESGPAKGSASNPYTPQSDPFFDPFEMFGQQQQPQAAAAPSKEDPFKLYGQLQYGSPDQIAALKKLRSYGYKNGQYMAQAPGFLRYQTSDYFPGNDNEYLKNLFPGITGVKEGPNRYIHPNEMHAALVKLMENPEYQALFNR